MKEMYKIVVRSPFTGAMIVIEEHLTLDQAQKVALMCRLDGNLTFIYSQLDPIK